MGTFKNKGRTPKEEFEHKSTRKTSNRKPEISMGTG